MSRAGYHDDGEDNWSLICWRGAVASAIRGRRGQAFLKEMLAALDAMPEKRLIAGDLVFDGRPESSDPDEWSDIIIGADRLVHAAGGGHTICIGDICAMGSVGVARRLDVTKIDPYEADDVAHLFGVAPALAREIAYQNDEGVYKPETPEQRFERMRAWVAAQIKE